MEEGYSTNKQPMFRGVKYDYWKEHKIAHFKSIHINLWDVVEIGNYIPYEDELNEFPRSQWREEQKSIFLLNYKARNIMLCTLSEEKKNKVHSFMSAKQM